MAHLIDISSLLNNKFTIHSFIIFHSPNTNEMLKHKEIHMNIYISFRNGSHANSRSIISALTFTARPHNFSSLSHSPSLVGLNKRLLLLQFGIIYFVYTMKPYWPSAPMQFVIVIITIPYWFLQNSHFICRFESNAREWRRERVRKRDSAE